MIFIYYFFAVVLVWFSYRSYTGGRRYLRYFREQLSRPASEFSPFVTVVAPCRGIDPGLEANLNAVLTQEYPDYEVIFVTDDADDPSIAVINAVISKINATDSAKVVVAPKAANSGQKVENLREAVLHAHDLSGAFVFVDSDICAQKDWLSSMVAPLANDNVGAATGYRWFISKHPSLASELRSAWNASIASSLGPNTKSNFCWGGSTAIRRDVFDRVAMRDAWAGTLSDDFVVTRTMKAAGLDIVFVPKAVSASVEDCTFAEMLEFTTRQMKITRVYATPLWMLSMFGSTLFCGVMISSPFIAIFSRSNSLQVWLALATLFLVTLFSVLKSWLRLSAIRLVLPRYAGELARQALPQYTLFAVAPFIFLYNCLMALVSRRLVWRSTVYELKSPTETVIIRG